MEKEIELPKLRIAVCDDMPMIQSELVDILREILEKEEIPCNIVAFASGKELLEQIADVDLVFLDIEMPELDGIETGVRLKNENPECQIIIASGREDYFKKTYQLKALRFVSKPFDKDEVREALQAYLNEQHMGLEKIEVFSARNSYLIRQRDIQYIEAFNGGSIFFANGKEYRSNDSLNQVEELLNKDLFYKIHKTYIVGLRHVTDYTDKAVLLGEKELPLSRRQRKEFERVYMGFDIKYNKGK